MSGEWLTIESDPVVFDEFITDLFGAKGLAVRELLFMEPEALGAYESVFGIILLFKYGTKKTAERTIEESPSDDTIYFAQQVVPDACSTLAVVNLLCNLTDRVDVGPTIKEFVEITAPLDPNSRGIAVGSRSDFRGFQNSFAPSDMVDMSLPAKKDATGDVYHYVTFIYKNGAIWELDGLQLGPQRRSDADDTNYKTALMNVLQQRVTEISESDKSGNGQGISFNILLVVDDPIEKLEKSIAEAQAQGQPVDGMQAELEQLKAEKAEGREENKRRRHGYFPMIFDLLKALAEKDLLQPVIDDVKARKEANKK